MRESLWTAFLVSAPLLGVTMAVGIVISVMQALTQVNEMTLTYVPKFVAVFVVLILFGPWMMQTMLGFTSALLGNLGQFGQ
jgi:flagellar biosynthetic protein FliQ